MDVVDWLRGLGREQYVVSFRENAVTADLLPHLTTQVLKAASWPYCLRQTPPIWPPVLAEFSAQRGADDIFKRLAGRQVIDIPGDQVAPSPDRSPGPTGHMRRHH